MRCRGSRTGIPAPGPENGWSAFKREHRGVVVDRPGKVAGLLPHTAAKVKRLQVLRPDRHDRVGVLDCGKEVVEVEVQPRAPESVLVRVRRVAGDGELEVLERGFAVPAVGVAAGCAAIIATREGSIFRARSQSATA